MGCSVQDSRFKVQRSAIGVRGLMVELWDWGLRFRVLDLGFLGFGSDFQVRSIAFRIWGSTPNLKP